MSAGSFELDRRLAGDTVPVVELGLCSVLLMNDARFAWAVLVPRRAGLVEVSDLGDAERAVLWAEVDTVGRALARCVPCEKLNIGALGNIVQQLHVHVAARNQGDAAWPGPVWGSGEATSRGPAERDALVAKLREAILTVA